VREFWIAKSIGLLVVVRLTMVLLIVSLTVVSEVAGDSIIGFMLLIEFSKSMEDENSGGIIDSDDDDDDDDGKLYRDLHRHIDSIDRMSLRPPLVNPLLLLLILLLLLVHLEDNEYWGTNESVGITYDDAINTATIRETIIDFCDNYLGGCFERVEMERRVGKLKCSSQIGIFSISLFMHKGI